MKKSPVKHFLMLLFAGAVLAPRPAPAEDVFVFSVGSGDVAGNYYPVAKAVCEVFNASDDTRRRCSPEPTAGSVYNLTMLSAGELEFALVQSDWQTAAFEGAGTFGGLPPMSDLRGVISLFPEAITIIAAPGSGIGNATDLAGKAVDIGRPASGRNATIRALLDRLDVGTGFFGDVREFEPAYALDQLCEGQIDAAIFVVGDPSALVSTAIESCGATIASFAGPLISQAIAEGADYQAASIDLALYGLPDASVETVGVMATLLTRASVDPVLVSDLVAAIRENYADLGERVAVLRGLEALSDAEIGIAVPMHPGARAGQ